jgi:hypothetical protein
MRTPAARVAEVISHFIYGVPDDVEAACENRCGTIVLPRQGVRGPYVFCNEDCSLEHFARTAA